jgi:hypothetical protein
MSITKLYAGVVGDPLNTSGPQLAASVNQLIDTHVSHLKALPTAANAQTDTVYNVIGFYSGAAKGGGRFVWNATAAKTLHNGITHCSPESLAAWNGTRADIATLLNWTGSGTGVFVRLLDGYITPEMAGAFGDGAEADTFCISKSLVVGNVRLTPHSRYKITARIDVPSGRWIVGNRTSVIEMDGTQFNGTATQYATNTLGFLFNNLSDAGGLYGFQIKLVNPTNELIAGAVAIRNCSNINLVDLQISGFRKSKVIAVDTSTNCSINENYIHDCLLASSTTGQMTGIDIDNNRVGSSPSSGIEIRNNEIRNLTCSSGFIGSFGHQTDAINISHESTNKIVIDGNIIYNVGEGVDCFGKLCTITNNRIYDAYNIGVKLIHGASRNTVTGNKIYDAGLAGISITGTGPSTTDSELNDISDNFISGVNSSGIWTASVTAGIRVDNDNTTKYARRNFIKNNVIVNGSAMKYGVLLDVGSRDNEVEGNNVESFSLTEFVNSGTGNNVLVGKWYTSSTAWTPTFKGSTTAGAFTYSEQQGRYVKIGNTVTVFGRIVVSGITTAAAGELEIGGIPFTSLAGGGLLYSAAIAQYNKIPITTGSNYTQITARLLNNSNRLVLMQCGNNTDAVTINAASVAVGTTFVFSCTYLVP